MAPGFPCVGVPRYLILNAALGPFVGEVFAAVWIEIKKPPGGGALMRLLCSLPEGLAEQGFRPRARVHATIDP
jgi:hypothetical protein